MYNNRIKKLQEQLIKKGLKAYVIRTSDPHLSEMIANHYLYRRLYFCPFTGSNATLLITQTNAYLYTDGRYWVQASKELEGTNIELVYDGKDGVDSIYDYIKKNDLYPLGLDISLVSNSELEKYQKGNNKVFDIDFSSLISDLPSLPKDKIWKLNDEIVGESSKDKINRILSEIKKVGADAIIISALDDIAYVLNYRGNDIPCTPVFYSFLYLDIKGNVDLFIDEEKLPNVFMYNVNIHPYNDIYSFIESKENIVFSLDPSRTNAKIMRKAKNKIKQTCPAYLFKSIKNKTEITKTKEVQALDGLKFVKLQKYIDDNIESGELDEYKIGQYIDNLREEDDKCFSPSFDSIVAIDSNAAMMHYKPKVEGSRKLDENSQIVLIDSGGHYYGGTTDITRTFVVNKNPSREVITDFTLTLKSHISLAKAIFEKGCTGQSLDYAARSVMWDRGLDYKCGTGHGVGNMLCVHEGPISFRYTNPLNGQGEVLVPGHIITDEPGVYKEGKYGIRLENELLVRDAFNFDNEEAKKQVQGVFFAFESISYVPFDIRGIDVSMLIDIELEWLNKYHSRVYDILSKLIENDNELKDYLYKITRPLSR